MYSTGGVADRFVPLWSRVEKRLGGPLPAALRFWDGSEIGPGDEGSCPDVIVLRSKRALSYAVSRPDQLGIARAFVAGDLVLEGSIERVMAAGASLYGFDFTLADKLEAARLATALGAIRIPPPKPPEIEAKPKGRLHSLRRDSESIQHHYDVSNDFYRLFLGPTMVYSCGYFDSPEDSLETAQTRKLDVVCQKLRLEPGERLLDIGCGWGSLAIHAATSYGVDVLGVTLSPAQAELARQRVAEAGLEDKVEIRVQDYREVADEPFDKICSIGMFEHTGSDIDRYFEETAKLGRPGGLALHHGICRQHSDDESPNTFITHYVFPDGKLHRAARVIAGLERSGQELRDVENLREHYALTLRHWVANLAEHQAAGIAEVGEQRERVWRLYMTASYLAFERGDIGVNQILGVIPDRDRTALYRPSPGLPLARPAFVREPVSADQVEPA